jgi:hypothetical protein
MKRVEPKLVKDIIDQALYSGDNSRKALEQRASYLWPEVVGSGVNRYTLRRYVADGVLHVYLTSAPLKNELSYCRDSIIKSINEIIGSDVISAIEIH